MAKTLYRDELHKGYIDLDQNEIRNARVQNLSTAPSSPVAGQLYYDSDDNVLYFWNGATWVSASGSTYTDEQVRDVIGAALVAGNNIDIAVDDSGNTITIDVEALTSGDLSDFIEAVSDQVGSMVTGNTETGITVTYQDADNTLDFAVDFSGAVMDGDAAGGVLSGTYPNPGFAVDMATQAELDAHINDSSDAHDASAISFSPSGDISSTDTQAALLEALADAKAYADALANGLKVHASVELVEISTSLDLSGAETIDGVSTPNGARVLLTAQADADDNGIWIVNTGGAWTRPTDFNDATDVVEGAVVWVTEGSAQYEGTQWTLVEVAGSFGSLTTQTWEQSSGVGQVTAGAALTKTGNQLDVGVDNTTIEVNADALRIAATAAGAGLTGGGGSALAVGAGTGISVAADTVGVDTSVVVRKYATTITGGSTSEVVTHNLGTRDVTVALINNSTPWDSVEVEWAATSTNTITLSSPVNLPASYRCVVHG